VIAASIFVVAAVGNGAGLSLEVIMVCMAIIHCIKGLNHCTQWINDSLLDQWIKATNESLDTGAMANANYQSDQHLTDRC
jgi:hypothetical protein